MAGGERFELDRGAVLGALAAVADQGVKLTLNSLAVNDDGVLVIERPLQPAQASFRLDGLTFSLGVHHGDAPGTDYQMWTEVGHVPFTAQSPAKRRDVLAILRHSRGLSRARFVIDGGQAILAAAEGHVDGAMTVDALMHETVQFIHEARPYLRLLKEYV